MSGPPGIANGPPRSGPLRIAGIRRTLPILLLLLCAARAGAEYRTVEVESLKITFDSDWAVRASPGYLPIRFDITNLGDARTIEIAGEGTRFYSRGGGRAGGTTVRHTVRLARGDRVRFTLPVPIFADHESVRFEIRENDTTIQHFNMAGMQGKTPAADASALIVADRSSAFSARAVSWPRTVSSSGGVVRSGAVAPPLDLVVHPSRLPANWLGYTSLRAVLIGPAEWAQLNDAQKSALLTWTACGGDLIVVDGTLAALFPGHRSSGTGSDPHVRAYFFGRIHLETSDGIDAAGLPGVLAEADTVQDSNWALPANRASDWGTITARGFRLPIPGVGGVPARVYLSILIAFSLFIGPLNYWFLWRRRQQVLFVLTAPLISVVFIVLLGAYVMAGEGVGVRGRAVTFTMLDEVRKQAVTRGSISLYAAGMTPSGGLRFSRETAVFMIGPDGSGSRDHQVLDLTEAQRYRAGVIQARSPTNLEQIVHRAARERLSFSRGPGGLSVVNGLGTTVTRLLYRDGDAVYSTAGPIGTGARADLQAVTLDAHTIVPADLPQSARFTYLVENQPRGSYLAVLESSPFWEPGVSGVSERGSFHLVIGWPGGQP